MVRFSSLEIKFFIDLYGIDGFLRGNVSALY